MNFEQTNNRNIFSEKDLVDRIAFMLTDEGFLVDTEIPNMGQLVDIIAIKDNYITTIEVKTKDWKRAIKQCKAHKLVADYICLAVGTKNISKTLISEVNKYGYGLIHCSPELLQPKWIIIPEKNRNYWEPQREVFQNIIKRFSLWQ